MRIKLLAHLAVLTLAWLLVFHQALYAGFTLIDDGTLNWEALQAISHPNWMGEIQDVWYRPRVQEGSRYLPAWWLLRWTEVKLFWPNPLPMHLIHLLVCIFPLAAGGYALARTFSHAIYLYLPSLVFCMFFDVSWSSVSWNLFDISTFDPLATAGFVTTLVLFAEVPFLRSNRLKILALAGVYLASFIATHAKESVAVATGGLIPFLLLFCIVYRRDRWCVAASMLVALNVVTFLVGFYTSGAYTASRSASYASGYQPTVTIMTQSLKQFSIIIGNLTGLLIPIVFILAVPPGIALIRAGSKLKSYGIQRQDTLFFLLGSGSVSSLVAVLPFRDIGAVNRFAHIWCSTFSLFSVLVIATAWQNRKLIFPHLQNYLVVRSATSTAIVLGLALLPFVPLRIISFSTFYRSLLQSEYELSEQVRSRLARYPDSQVEVIAINDQPSFYWGIHNHLRNMGLPNPQARLKWLKSSDVEAPTESTGGRYIVIVSRAPAFSNPIVDDFSVAIPVNNTRIISFNRTRAIDLGRWFFSNGNAPWHFEVYRHGHYICLTD